MEAGAEKAVVNNKQRWYTALCLLLIPATLLLGTRLTGRWYYLTCTLVILEAMVPFFLSFESRRPQARELVTIAVLCALAVASRVVILIPNFKPITGIIMLAGIGLGPQVGFLTGAVAAFASNFFFSQGPWTPWQMMAYGVGGFLAGAVFSGRPRWQKPWILGIFGFFAILLVVGPLLDSCTVFTVSTTLTWKFALAVFASGAPYNAQHGLACAVTLFLFGKPLLGKLDRLKTKYGMLEEQ